LYLLHLTLFLSRLTSEWFQLKIITNVFVDVHLGSMISFFFFGH